VQEFDQTSLARFPRDLANVRFWPVLLKNSP
jgi:hypothetical protein